MRILSRFIYILILLFVVNVGAEAQSGKVRETYKVKKKDTVYGIAHKYNLSIDELLKANPGAADADFNIKKGTILQIPYPQENAVKTAKPSVSSKPAIASKPKNSVSIGVMLPLHDNDGDGRRMLEYYRGVLMACDSLKKSGISTTVYSWNVAADKNINSFLGDENLAKCDVVFGPLYTSMVKPLAAFCKKNDIRMVIPFSISGNDVKDNPEIFQVYQSPTELNQRAIDAFLERFPNRHVVFIDCNDTTSKKGIFTFELRKRLEARGQKYSITNLKSSEANFSKAFSRTLSNVVVLNTGRSPELNVAFAKLNGLRVTDPSVPVSMYGYTEWLMYTKVYFELFHKYDVYIPTTFYYNSADKRTAQFESHYQNHFHSDLQTALPRFAITGYDHAQYFVRGMVKYGKNFVGAKWQNVFMPLQSSLKFAKTGEGGGYKNAGFMLVHYRPAGGMERIDY